MKKYLFLAALFCMGSVCLTSCGDDDDEEFNFDDNTEYKVGKPTLKKEDGKRLTLSYTESYGKIKVDIVEDWKFENRQCVSATVTETYPSESLAKTAYNEMQKEGEAENLTRDGKKLIFDSSSSYKGMSYENLEEMLNWRIKEWDHMMNK